MLVTLCAGHPAHFLRGEIATVSACDHLFCQFVDALSSGAREFLRTMVATSSLSCRVGCPRATTVAKRFAILTII